MSFEIEQSLTSLIQIIPFILLLLFLTSQLPEREEQIQTFDRTRINLLFEELIKSPNCLAYEELSFFKKKDDDGISLKRNTKPGLIDLTKFYDKNYFDCVRYNELYDKFEINTDQEINHCGYVGEKESTVWEQATIFVPYTFNLLSFGINIIPVSIRTPVVKSCEDYDICKDKNCFCSAGTCRKFCTEPGECNAGEFIIYEAKITDLENENEFKTVTRDSFNLFLYNPYVHNGGTGTEKDSDGVPLAFSGINIPTYLSCESPFIDQIVDYNLPIKIIYPDKTENFAKIDVRFCLGQYGQKTIKNKN